MELEEKRVIEEQMEEKDDFNETIGICVRDAGI